ncbi:metallophosphoesterase [Paraglaciecola sp.]|uniref:metallophosphoesterase family protein n=1 Tax=Paraglaciecola sp. TaxID=1920173 RepID=UPI00273E4F97|nr:metallophosphoesterase [Paraglaciecola sp.]MDP5029577.1 metallophosphoesterase [Paraglaciecola sp.]
MRIFSFFRNKLIIPLLTCGAVACSTALTQQVTPSSRHSTEFRIAFMPDIHFHDIYAQFNDGSFQGLANSVSGKNATIRTLSAQLNSTRLFNENYFAFIAALDDVVKRGIKWVALPGDFSDDGQQVHMRGLAKILDHYHQQYGIEFFATPGNHDPVKPFEQPAGKVDYLGTNGQPQRIFSRGAEECVSYSGDWGLIETDSTLPTICSEEVKELGYQGIVDQLAPYGFYPKANYLYWESPYSDYTVETYDFDAALKQAKLTNREYTMCADPDPQSIKTLASHCVAIPDTSYLVEPINGLWLLAIDANVYLPKAEGFNTVQPTHPSNFTGSGNNGYNKMLSHKKHVINWISDVVRRAEQGGKKLIAFSHFPMTEFYDGQSAFIANYFGEDKFQLARTPQKQVSETLATLGLKIHVGGHMHINDTGLIRHAEGQFLFNIQAPSIAAYVPAYKILSVKNVSNIEVQTIVLNDVPRFNELFEHYRQEYQALKQQDLTQLWNKDILKSKTYKEFTQWHITELTRQRFLPKEWPQATRELLLSMTGQDLFILSQLPIQVQANVRTAAAIKSIISTIDWQQAEQRANTLCESAGFNLKDFAQWDGFALAVDFYRLRNAGQLAIEDIGLERLAQYHLLTKILAKQGTQATKNKKQNSMIAEQFGPIFYLLEQFQQGQPDDHFMLNMQDGTITELP